jgi:hypothetical protein
MHYKGTKYTLVGLALREEDMATMVIYCDSIAPSVFRLPWVRPLSQWNEIVQWNGKLVRRFSPYDGGVVQSRMRNIQKNNKRSHSSDEDEDENDNGFFDERLFT